ncbi:30S ribosomal protein S20 [Durusdinium trenchii]|uniref:30S ribosomal protein S20 n=1 Tax=Durusdinium trenchii TaxID=1381693 RepID=A0ABP0S365_9DINO
MSSSQTTGQLDIYSNSLHLSLPSGLPQLSSPPLVSLQSLHLEPLHHLEQQKRGSANRQGRQGFEITVVAPESPALAGGSVSGLPRSQSESKPSRGKVARRSLYSCYTLYFRRWRYYEDRARRNLRNRAYNIFMKNRYKKAMKKVLRYCAELEFDDKQPDSFQQVMDEVKDMLDEACEIIDEVTVQGVLHKNTAAKHKDRLFIAILRGSVKKGLIQKPEDPFTPAWKVIGYTLPECNMLREPRPWQLPGWKSPWMLKREWEKWRKLSGRK